MAAARDTLVAFAAARVQSPAMPELAPPPPLPSAQSFLRRNRSILKLLGIGALVLVLVLLIPLALIEGVLSDRLERGNQAVDEITASWGKEQNLIGPVLGIPFQYLMVGAALSLFYLLLLSISEFLGFGLAYLIAAVSATVLITWYCHFFLGGGVRTLMIGAGLAGVYTFLYIVLRQQDYALLMGAIALFLLLAVVMFVTRRVDWYGRDLA